MAIKLSNFKFIFFILTFVTLTFSNYGLASNKILIWPVDPILRANSNATELWLENKGKQSVTMQIRIFGWQQISGQENYRSQQDVVASPPIVTIAAGKKQLVRLIRQTAVAPGKERAFRILIDEVPAAAKIPSTPTNVSLQMRYSVPFFVYGEGVPLRTEVFQPIAPVQRHLRWRAINHNGVPSIEIINQGPIRARLSKVSVNGKLLAEGLYGYVLADSSRVWPLPKGMHASRLVAQVNNEKEIWQSGPTP